MRGEGEGRERGGRGEGEGRERGGRGEGRYTSLSSMQEGLKP